MPEKIKSYKIHEQTRTERTTYFCRVAQGGEGGNAKDRGGDRAVKTSALARISEHEKAPDYNSPKHSDKNKGRSGRKQKYS